MAMKLSSSIFVAVCVLMIVLVLLKLVIHQQKIIGQPLQQEDSGKELVAALNQSCCSVAMQYKVEYLCSREISSLVSHCSCSDYLMCKLVMVTALSSNHFVESIDFFGSVYAYFPQVKVVVYDLGLTMNEVSCIQSYCNVLEVRKFNLTRACYPSHIKDLHNYAWKIFIISEMSEEYELFFYCDASCRMKSIIPHYLPNILKFPVLPASWLNDSIVKTTHDGMLKYFGEQRSRQELEQLLPHGFQAIVIFWANVVFKEKLLPSLIDCASHLECIAPKGSHLWGCYKALKPIYWWCHRYDQSALNMLLLRDFGDTLVALDKQSRTELVDIARSPTMQYDNRMSHQCNILYTAVEEAQTGVSGVSVFVVLLFFVLFVAGICKLNGHYCILN